VCWTLFLLFICLLSILLILSNNIWNHQQFIHTFLCFDMIPNIFPIFSACERLILLKNDANELRDYSILLYHCGLYEQSLEYLTKYRDLKVLLRSFAMYMWMWLLFNVNWVRCLPFNFCRTHLRKNYHHQTLLAAWRKMPWITWWCAWILYWWSKGGVGHLMPRIFLVIILNHGSSSSSMFIETTSQKICIKPYWKWMLMVHGCGNFMKRKRRMRKGDGKINIIILDDKMRMIRHKE